MRISEAEAKSKRLQTMQRGVAAAALSIDRKMREEFGEPIYKAVRPARARRGYDPFSVESAYRVALITLTYADGVAWEPNQIRLLLKNYREWFRKRGHKFRFVWTVELQGNGKPHYHVVAWFPGRLKPPLPDDQGWWPHGMSNAVWARSPVGYIAKYASKSESKSGMHLPKGCRLWGHGGLSMDDRALVAYATAPSWLKEVVRDVAAHPRRRKVASSVYMTLGGKVLQFAREVTAWVVSKGEGAGWAYVSPYRFSEVSRGGLALDHLGVIEAICPQGESFFIQHNRGAL